PAPPLLDSVPFAFAVPVPLMFPPLQLVVPVTVRVPVPVSVLLESVKFVIDAAALSVQVPPLLMTASSAPPGTPFRLQFVAVNQSPEATFQLKLVACAASPESREEAPSDHRMSSCYVRRR